MIQVLNAAYTLAAFSLLLLAGRFLVRVLSFGRHEANPVYRLFVVLTSPLVWLARRVSPAFVLDRHLPLAAFLLLCWVCAGFAFGLPKLVGAGR
jgi:hypothetical protein